MKKQQFILMSLLMILFLGFQKISKAQSVSGGINFQAIARDSYANPAKDRKIFVEASIIQTSSSGTVVLKEKFETLTDATGVFSIVIGRGTRLAGTAANLESINWANGPFFLGMKVAIAPIAPVDTWDYTKDLVDLGTTSLGSVPYALYAGNVAGFDTKLNSADTTKMLSSYARVANLNSLMTNKVNVADSTTVYVTPTQLASKTFDQAPINAAIATKLNIADSITKYVTPKQLAAKTFDSTAIYNQLALKANTTDVNTSLGLKANVTDVTTSLNLKENTSNKSIDVTADGTSDTKYPSAKAVKSYVDTQIAGATIADANATTKGKLQLAGDLTGTAAAPTIANNAITTTKIIDGAVTTAKITDANVTDSKILSVSGSKVVGNISGNAATATKIATPVTINGVSFDGSSNITISSAAANALTMNNSGSGDNSGTTFDGSAAKTISYNTIGASPLAGSSSLTTVGTITSGTWNGSTIAIANGGTGLTNITSGQILFGNGSNPIGTNSNLFWDNTNSSLGVGTNTPGAGLNTSFDVVGRASIRPNNSNGGIIFDGNSGSFARIYTDATTGTPDNLVLGTYPYGHMNQLFLKQSNGFVGIRNSNPTTALDVNGTVTATGFAGNLTGNVTGNLTGNVTGNISGNAGTATKLAATKNINGVAFDGSTDITVASDANTLSGTTLASNVVSSSLTSVGTITSGVWSGTAIANNKLANSALTIGSTNIALGATSNTLAGLSTVTSTNFNGNLTGDVTGNVSGNAGTATKLAATKNINGVAFDGSTDITIAANANTLTGTTLANNVVTSSLTSVGTITSGVWSGTAIAIANGGTGATTASAALSNLGAEPTSNKSTDTNLGNSSPSDALFPSQKAAKTYIDTKVASAVSSGAPDATTTGKGLVQLSGDLGGTYNSPTVLTVGGASASNINTATSAVLAATNLNTASKIVQRDATGNFSAGIITAELSGNANTASALQTARKINGVNFDGSSDITIVAASNTLTGTTLASNVVSSSLTSVGTINTGVWSGTAIAITNGGTGASSATGALTNLGAEASANKSTDVNLGTSSTLYPTQNAVKSYVDTKVAGATIPSATTSAEGKIQLAGDLGGTAASPSVVTVGGSTASNINTATIAVQSATNSNTNNTIVKRDASGNFSASTITSNIIGNLTGNVTGNLTGDVTGNVSGTSLNVTGIVLGANGGTGVNNNGKTITLGGNLTTVGANPISLTTGGTTNLTLPTSGTLATLTGTESLTNKTLNGLQLNASSLGFTIAGGTSTSTTLTVGGDASITGSNTGDQTITLTGDVSGTGTGSFVTTLASTGVVSNTYGSSNQIPVIGVDSKGRITSVTPTNITINGAPLTDGKILIGSGGVAQEQTLSGDLTVNNSGVTTIANNAVNTSKIADASITNAKIGETLSVAKGGTGSTSLTGYIKGNTLSPMTSVAKIPVADVTGAVVKVNGVQPDGNGNVTVPTVAVMTGTYTDFTVIRGGTYTGTAGTTYVISQDAASNNGRTFIFDGSNTWHEITTNQSATDARYLIKSGDAMTGTLTVPSITISNTPSASTDATNKDYVDNLVTNATPSATLSATGKIQLAGDLGGTATIPTVIKVGGSTASAINSATIAANSATASNTNNTIVLRDASGNFSANTISANLTGNVTGNLTGNVTGIATNVSGTVAVANGGTGATTLTGYIKGSGTNAFTASSSIPVADVTGAEPTANKSDNTNLGNSTTLYPTQNAVKTYVDNTISSATVSATTSSFGVIKLAGDFGGTAASPSVLTVGGASASNINTATSAVLAATNLNTASKLVQRDASGNFSAGTITAALSGNANTASTLQTARKINGINFDGSTDITVAAASNTLTGTTLASNIVSSSLTSVGTISTGVWSGTAIAVANGGTGATTASAALTNLGAEATANKSTATDLGNTSPSNTLYPTQNAVKTYVDGKVAGATIPSATTSAEGKIQLAGDLGGTSTSPTVVTVGGSTASNINSATLAVLAATSSNTANKIVQRDASGNFSAGQITVTKINGLTPTAQSTGFTLAGGNTTSKTLTVSNDASVSGTNTGDQTITLTGDLTGTGTGTFTTTLASSGVTAGTYGSSTAIPSLTIDAKGRITNATTTSIIAGVNTVGTIAGTSNANGATISGTTLTLTPADASNGGIVTTGAQTFVGAKTFSSTITGSITGNAGTATTLATGRTIGITGDITYTSPSFDGSGNITGTGTLTNTGVTSGTYGSSTAIPSLTIDSKGRITSATTTSIIAGVNTVAAIGGTSNAAGATISGTTITLTPADASNGGILTNGAQTIAGAKTFTNTTASTSTTSGAVIVNGGIGIGGAVYAGSIQNTPIGSTTANTGAFTTLAASGATSLSSTLNVTGATTLSSTSAHGGAATFSSTINVAGAATLASASVTGNETVGGTLVVTGATTLTALTTTGTATLSGTVNIPSNAGAGKVLISDATGNATWNSNPYASIYLINAATASTAYAADLTKKYIIYNYGTAEAGKISLPAAATANAGAEIIIKNKSANTVTITPLSGTVYIDNANTSAASVSIGIEASNNWVRLVSDGTQWIVFRALF